MRKIKAISTIIIICEEDLKQINDEEILFELEQVLNNLNDPVQIKIRDENKNLFLRFHIGSCEPLK